MENERDPVVMRAIENVRLRYAPEQWATLESKRVTREIYDEIRRLDLEAVQAGKIDDDPAVDRPRSRKPSKVADDERPPIVWAAE